MPVSRSWSSGVGGSVGHADGDADVGFGGAAVALGGEMEVGGVGGRDGLGAVDRDLPMPSMVTTVAFGGAPVEDDGLAESMASGSAVRVAVGAGAVAAGGPEAGGERRVGFLVAAGDGEP